MVVEKSEKKLDDATKDVVKKDRKKEQKLGGRSNLLFSACLFNHHSFSQFLLKFKSYSS